MENVVIDDGIDINTAAAAEFEQMAADVEQAAAVAEELAGIATREEFEQNFFEIFDICGDLWDIQELKIDRTKPFEVLGAKVSANKLYNMAQKYKLLHFLIEPSGGWFGDGLAVLCFAGGKANAVCKKACGVNLAVKIRYTLNKIFKRGGVVEEKQGLFTRLFSKKSDEEQKA